MANKFKYNKTGTETDSLFKGNWAIDTTAPNSGGGPSSTTGLYVGADIPQGGYAVYGNGWVFIANNDEELLDMLNSLGANVYSVTDALAWIAGQPDYVVLNKSFDDIVTDGLVLNLDASSIASFYDNEPTTNLVPSAQNNGRFTTSNGWNTYNTNQYNGNTYFSIGVIGSVTDNIVTLSSVGRTIRSFDVLRAQTSGGGITAGTNYVIKKISANTFSLHQYNSSQNGSQGYRDPSTGFFKVHDAYANDTRIAINETGFPTMWWGAPHLPNSGLIKEIINGGGRVPDTNAMRLHAYREDGVVDGMAYGVYCPVTAGDTITMSVWLKLGDNRKPDASLGYSTYFGAGNGSFGTRFYGLTSEWQRFTATWTASVTYNFYSYWWPSAGPMAIDMCDFQVETNRDTPSGFTTGSRLQNTTCYDLISNDTSTLTNGVGFDSGSWTFDGIDDYIEINQAAPLIAGGNFTLSAWIKGPTQDHKGIIPINDAAGGNRALFLIRNASMGIYDGGTWYIGNIDVDDDIWHHVTLTYHRTSKNAIIYVDGQISLNATTNNMITVAPDDRISIGQEWDGGTTSDHFLGNITAINIYNKALTADEVTQNFSAQRNRFGI